MFDSENPMNPLCKEWLKKIDIAKKVKWEVFGQYAAEAVKFYDGAHDFMWKEEYASGMNGFLDKDGSNHLPTFRMTVNKCFEAVALFGPALMHRYPQVTVTSPSPPRFPPEAMGIDPNDPYAAQSYEQYLQADQMDRSMKESHAAIFQHYLNWLQVETNKKYAARAAITEAIVKGLGVMRTDVHVPYGSGIMAPRTRFMSCDDLVKDPDAVYQEDVQWIAIKNVKPLNIVARTFGIPEEDLRGHLQSYASQSTEQAKKDRKSNKSKDNSPSYDLVEYWEVFSKNGFGHRLSQGKRYEEPKKAPLNYDFFGDYCYIVVAKGIPFPLNFPTWALAEEPDQQFERAQWPIPYWTDSSCGNGWPISELHFYEKMNCVWPLSLIKPAIGELRFVNWCMSFLADKVAASATTYVAVAKGAGMEIQNQLQNGLAPYTTVEIAELFGKSIHEVVSFLEAPNFSIDIWNMVSQAMDLIDKRTGLTELIYGLSGRQMRSATEADVRDSRVSIRPDDMAERTEDFYSQSAMKEVEAMVWALNGDDVRPIIGDAGAMMFEDHIQVQEFERVVRDYSYRVAAGSARKPNKNNRMRQLNDWGQVAAPVLQQFAMQGMVGPWNAYVSEVAKAMDLDANAFLVELPQQEQQGPSEDEIQHEAEMERDEESHEQELRHKEEEHRLDLALKKSEAAMKRQMAGNGSSQ